MKSLLFAGIITLFLSHSANAIVDMRTANFGDVWNDLTARGTGYDLRYQRSFNSRTIYSGFNGFGWCSDYETSLEVNAEGNLRITECGGGLQVTYTQKHFDQKSIKKTVNTIIAEVKKRNPSRTAKYLRGLTVEMTENKYLREEFARQLKLKGKVVKGKHYLANNRENDYIVLKGKEYIRYVPDGTFQRFNLKGKLTALHDKNGNFLKLIYKNKKLASVIDNNGRKLTFKFYPNSNLLASITGPNGLSASYKYKNDNLISVTNAWKNTYTYKYNKLHNLIAINFPDGTSKELTYNNDKDWVTSFKNRKGCLETYTYEDDPKRPLDHYWSSVKKVCKNKVTNTSRYEFWHRKNKAGRYLHRAKTTVNGTVTDVTYHSVFGRPLSVLSGGVRTSYKYYKSGLVYTKQVQNRISKFEYKNKCKKVSKVETRTIQKKGKKRRIAAAKKSYTSFQYDKNKCNLISAKTNKGMKVSLKYDVKGRITLIRDQSKKLVRIQYESKFGKPSLIERPGLGSIKVTYKNRGEVDKTTSKEGPLVAKQVASVFNNLLEIIAPATSELNI